MGFEYRFFYAIEARTGDIKDDIELIKEILKKLGFISFGPVGTEKREDVYIVLNDSLGLKLRNKKSNGRFSKMEIKLLLKLIKIPGRKSKQFQVEVWEKTLRVASPSSIAFYKPDEDLKAILGKLKKHDRTNGVVDCCKLMADWKGKDFKARSLCVKKRRYQVRAASLVVEITSVEVSAAYSILPNAQKFRSVAIEGDPKSMMEVIPALFEAFSNRYTSIHEGGYPCFLASTANREPSEDRKEASVRIQTKREPKPKESKI
ncbi:hypothetical protein AAMO2058_000919800 [Amorphochlora amoebiformis]